MYHMYRYNKKLYNRVINATEAIFRLRRRLGLKSANHDSWFVHCILLKTVGLLPDVFSYIIFALLTGTFIGEWR